MVRNPSIFVAILVTVLFLSWERTARAETTASFNDTRNSYKIAQERIAQETSSQHQTLVQSYARALDKLEEELQTAGNLDGILRVRQEKKSVLDSGHPAKLQDPVIEARRQVFLTAKAEINAKRQTAEAALDTAYVEHLSTLEVNLTKLGKIDEALATRAEKERVASHLAASASSSPKTSEPRNNSTGGETIAIPTLTPPPASENPFKSDLWSRSMTVPSGRYRLRSKLLVKRAAQQAEHPLILLEKGTILSASEEGSILVEHGQIVAHGAQLLDLSLRCDLSARMYFKDSTLQGCTIGKGGGWFAAPFASRWYFENCVVERSLMSEPLDVELVGIHMFNSVVRNVTLPNVVFRNNSPLKMRQEKWLSVRNTRFEKCKVPVSFLLIAEGCAFVDCTYVDDDKLLAVDGPVSVTIYEDKSVSKIKSPGNIQLIQKPLSAMPK